MSKDFKNKMYEKIKIYSDEKYLKDYINNEFLTDDGDADIFLKLENKDDLFDSRTIDNQLALNSSIYEYIEEKTSMLDSDIQIHLHILGLNLTNKEEEIVKHLIREHYAIELYKNQRQYQEYRNKIITLILLGVLCLICYAFLYFLTDFDFFMEVLGFLFSFSLWEAFDCLIYSFNDVKSDREAITQNLLIEVNFARESDQKK